ncbi:MAG: hypothetical protein ACRD28_05255 [Acidobacteriaceae bacterium]
MILQPTLVLLCGSGAEQLKEQVVRWISEDERHAFYFAHINEAEEMEHAIPVAVHELRSAKLLSELIRGGYVPKNYRLQEFRTLIVCLSEDQDWIRTARRQLEVSLEATPFLNRIFWVVLLEQEKIQELQDTQQKLFADFGGNESVTLFHVLPFWRGSNLDPEDTSAILERLTVLLLKADTEASLPMIAEIARNKSAWAIGIEAYRLKGHCEAGKCALFLAARELIAQCFTGQPLSAPTLANLVREKIPDFDSQADLDPFSPEGLELVGRYVRDYVPELLDALASHSPDVESWLDCLKHLKREAAKPKRAGLLGSGGTTADGKAKPGYSGLSVLLMTVSAAACYLLFKPSAASAPAEQMNLALVGSAKAKQDLPHHPIFAAALERILADIQPLRYPERLQESLPSPEVETPIPTDNVETAKVDRTLIDAARDLLLQRTFALPSLLSFQFLTGEMTPASAMTRVLSAQEEMEKKLEGILIDEWLTKVRESRREKNSETDSEWLDFMFASPIPNPVHMECEIADHENRPQQPGWFPQSWLHYVHAVEIR